MTDTLLPCPYCGVLPRMFGAQHILNFESIDCDNDDCTLNPTTGYMLYEEAVTAWNTITSLKETT
jgi:hypothetical protein